MINNNISIENVQLILRNFAGRPTKFTPAGRRTFGIRLPEDVAFDLKDSGWPVKEFVRENDDIPSYWLPVSLSFEKFPPKVMVIDKTTNTKTMLDENTIANLDWAEIENVDIVLRPYTWEMNGRTGIKAYLKSMYVTLYADEFEAKYSDISSVECPF